MILYKFVETVGSIKTIHRACDPKCLPQTESALGVTYQVACCTKDFCND